MVCEIRSLTSLQKHAVGVRCRHWDGFREGPRGLRPPLLLGSGIFLDNVLEWYTNLQIQDDETVTKTLHLQNFYLNFQKFEGLRFQNFPGKLAPKPRFVDRLVP